MIFLGLAVAPGHTERRPHSGQIEFQRWPNRRGSGTSHDGAYVNCFVLAEAREVLANAKFRAHAKRDSEDMPAGVRRAYVAFAKQLLMAIAEPRSNE